MPAQLLLDTSSLMYRAFFSVPVTVTGKDGRPVNAVFGYLNMTALLIESRHPVETIHVYDADWRPAPRVAIYQGYKANRPPDPEGLPEQFELLRSILGALGLAQAEAPGWEAEDAIGTICASGRGDDRFEIVTGDRDLLQLIRDPVVRVLFTLRGVSKLAVFDEAAVEEKYGVSPSRYVDFAILRGDPSDGLPGIQGVGEKTARSLVNAYQSLDELVGDAAGQRRMGAPLQRSPSLRASIRDAGDYLRAMQKIVPIRTDLDLTRWSGSAPGGADEEALEELGDRHRLSGPIRRLRAALR